MLKDLAFMFSLMTTLYFLGTHTIVSFLAFFTNSIEVKKKLRNAISYGRTQTFESKNRFMSKVRMDSSDILNCTSRLLMICIVKNQADVPCLMIGTHMDTLP